MYTSNDYHLLPGSYWTSNADYQGMSSIERQHALVNKKTSERICLHVLTDVARGTRLKNVKIPQKYAKQLTTA